MTQIIIDCDPGVDDAAALLLALVSPELDVLGITLVGGNVPLDAVRLNAAKLIGLSGRSDVPIFAGCPGPLVRTQVFGKYAHVGAFADALVPPSGDALSTTHAVEFIVQCARAAAAVGQPITLCCIAPLTNIALALAHDPAVAHGIARIVMMGGAFTALGNRAPWAEFNVYADPHAAEMVFTSGVEVVMMPLDVTFQALVTDEHLATLRLRCGRPGAALAALISAYDRNDPERFGRPGGPLHDATTIAWLLEPDLFTLRSAAVGVECQGVTPGHTYADFHGKGARAVNAQVARTIDVAGFFTLLLGRMGRYHPSPS